ncbi:hypothetical protein chiPu_0012033 [Chiloscyllium punctatum]|uniref:Peptidase M14 domain-containing protein n=1 Tax=Chiloscyllium punctatum TaxID=137246 RepID=A0A401ST63_CHIPU|nr:hypothetical protein [Chiloscyllium punctatum]
MRYYYHRAGVVAEGGDCPGGRAERLHLFMTLSSPPIPTGKPRYPIPETKADSGGGYRLQDPPPVLLIGVQLKASGTIRPQSLLKDAPHLKELESFLRDINTNYSSITHLYSVGTSVTGLNLWVLAIGKYPKDHTVGIPDVKYIGNIHGDEVVGREILLHFIEYLVEMYDKDTMITNLINNARIHIMPSMNPDGFEITHREKQDCSSSEGRYNKRQIDLNRNFPDAFENNTLLLELETSAIMDWIEKNVARFEPETRAIMRWIMNETFVLSTSLHGGALVASYPYDNIQPAIDYSGYSRCPDDDVFVYLAKNYSYSHATMYNGDECETTPNFKDGITNGADWYYFSGKSCS